MMAGMRIAMAVGFAATVFSATALSAQNAPRPLTAPPATAARAAAAAPQAIIQTSMGAITLTLDPARAPKSVANFIAYARERHFDGTVIYRVAPGFVIQMGSYEANGEARPVHAPIPLESADGLTNVRGAVAMARMDDPTSGTAEFFIDLDDNAALDPKPNAPPNATGYAVFGHITGGMDVVDRIAGVPRGGAGPFPPEVTPASPITIEKVTVVP
jgi:cyclophilin family peptidyl-prolyl cis-trans isomerase